MCSGIIAPAAIRSGVRGMLRNIAGRQWRDRLVPMTLLGAFRCLRGRLPADFRRIGHNKYRRGTCTHKAGDRNSSGTLN